MPDSEQACVTCSVTRDDAQLEKCGICSRFFCSDHAFRAYGGRRFCSTECARGYYFHGEMDEDDDGNEDLGTEE